MPDNQTDTNTQNNEQRIDALLDATPTVNAETGTVDATAVMSEVLNKLNEAHNVLVALSANPNVDEMCAAIGLSMALDRAGKRATAIYSGATPNALEFLRPEEKFDATADILQDFVIALSKDKADHLRYKLDGDFVKIFITPYKTKLDAEDLEFSYGDYNIDLVLALDVANGTDLDAALREHGRIMHDAVIVNMTTGNPGKFGDIQWSDKRASSVSEMAARLLYELGGNIVENEEATALLTGIIAATNRFSKANTTADTMEVASKLMMSGADQQLIAQNITMEMNNEVLGSLDVPDGEAADATALKIEHDEPENEAKLEEVKPEEVKLEEVKPEEVRPEEVKLEEVKPEEVKPEKVIAPSVDFGATLNDGDKYEKMMTEALKDAENVPDLNYMPMPGDETVPLPPPPPLDMNLGPQPAMQDQVYAPQVADPGAFQIPGGPAGA